MFTKIYGVSDMVTTIEITRKEIHCRHIMGYHRDLTYAPSHEVADIMAFITPVVEQRLEQEIAQGVHHEEQFVRAVSYSFCLESQP